MPDWNAFVLMPFDPDYDAVFQQLIRPPLEEAGFEVTRADLSINQQQILKDIVNGLAAADLVVVDVSGLNGNVMYELGLAHAMGRRTVMITRDIGELPFDLRSYRANGYSTEFTEAPKLRERLAEIAAGVVDGSAQFSNPVQDFAPEFLGRPEQISVSPLVVPAGNEGSSSGHLAEVESLGILDYAIQLSESNEKVASIAQDVMTATTTIGAQVIARTEQIERAQKNLGAKAAPVLRNIMRETAAEFDGFSEKLERSNPELLAELRLIGESANGLARLRNSATEHEKERIRAEILSVVQAEKSFSGARDSVLGFAAVLEGMAPIEQNLTLAVKRATRAVYATAEAIETGRAEFARVRGVLEERLDD